MQFQVIRLNAFGNYQTIATDFYCRHQQVDQENDGAGEQNQGHSGIAGIYLAV